MSKTILMLFILLGAAIGVFVTATYFYYQFPTKISETEMKECGTDSACLQKAYLDNCQPARGITPFGRNDTLIIVKMYGIVGNKCLAEFIFQNNHALNMSCSLPIGLPQVSQEVLLKYCSGSLVDSVKLAK